jgi:hypothetical protein
VAASIVKEIHDRGGRFLRFHVSDNVWREVDGAAAHYKVMQALRETKPAMDFLKGDVLKAVIKLGGGTHLVDAVKRPLHARSRETSASAATPQASLRGNYKMKSRREAGDVQEHKRVRTSPCEPKSDAHGPSLSPAPIVVAELPSEVSSSHIGSVDPLSQHHRKQNLQSPTHHHHHVDGFSPEEISFLLCADIGSDKEDDDGETMSEPLLSSQHHHNHHSQPTTHQHNRHVDGFSSEEARLQPGGGWIDDTEGDCADMSESGDSTSAGQPRSTQQASAVSMSSADSMPTLRGSHADGAQESHSVPSSIVVHYDTTEPSDHDVVLGRGLLLVRNHAGNKWCHTIVEEKSTLYYASSGPKKTEIFNEVVSLVRNRSPPGRFLEYDFEKEAWRDAGEKKVACMVRWSLRTARGLLAARDRYTDCRVKDATSSKFSST